MPEVTEPRLSTRTRVCRHLGMVALLLAVNFAVFYKHYLGSDMFPWDFWKTYYATVSFWMTLARHGIIAEWVPFQYMGYPFFLNPQTSFFYPPLWTFVLFGIHYSLHAAAIVQSLHVFWGAYGTYLLIKVLTGDWRSALFGALAYHFFGGFYCNAEHVDIVRAYSWLPWLFWSATPGNQLLPRNYLLPVIIYCAISGSYPGNIGSHFLFLGIYLLGAFYCSYRSGFKLKPIFWLFAFAALGLLLSTVVVIPALMMREALHHTTAKLATNGWPFHNWLSLVTPWAIGNSAVKGFIGDPSMISAYLGVPVVALIFLMNKNSSQRLRVWWIILIASLCLALGQASFFYNALSRIVPVLGLSRFPSSDYRGLIALAFIVLACASFEDWTRPARPSSIGFVRRRLAYVALLPVAILCGVFEVALPAAELQWVIVLWVLTLGALFLQTTRFRMPSVILTSFLILLLIVQGFHVITTSKWTWTAGGTDLDSRYKQRIGISTSSTEEPILGRLSSTPTRPGRVSRKREDFSWSGYLLGTFQIGDYSNTELNAQYQIAQDPVLSEFMKRPLTPIVFPNVSEVSRDMLTQRLAQSEQQYSDEKNQVIPQMYGLNSERYNVKLSNEATIIVNEIWFPGWEGRLFQTPNNYTRVSASSVDHALRVWHLPAGNYTFITRFKTPYLRASTIVSSTALLVYLGLLFVAALRKYKRSARAARPSGGQSLAPRT